MFAKVLYGLGTIAVFGGATIALLQSQPKLPEDPGPQAKIFPSSTPKPVPEIPSTLKTAFVEDIRGWISPNEIVNEDEAVELGVSACKLLNQGISLDEASRRLVSPDAPDHGVKSQSIISAKRVLCKSLNTKSPQPEKQNKESPSPKPTSVATTSCGDPSDDDANWYPVIVENGNVKEIQKRWCRDAILRGNGNDVQVASFTSYDRAEALAKQVGGKVGEMYRVKPKTTDFKGIRLKDTIAAKDDRTQFLEEFHRRTGTPTGDVFLVNGDLIMTEDYVIFLTQSYCNAFQGGMSMDEIANNLVWSGGTRIQQHLKLVILMMSRQYICPPK